MTNAKNLIYQLPELYLLLAVTMAGYKPPFSIAPISLGLAAVVIFQIVYKKKTLGLVIGSLVLVANVFMLLALISEVKEFSTFNIEARQLLFGGLLIWFVNAFFGGLILYKNRAAPEAFAKVDYVKN